MRVNSGGGYFFATYMKDALSQIKQYDKTGKLVREIKLPGNGTAGGFGGEKQKKNCIIHLPTTLRLQRSLNLM